MKTLKMMYLYGQVIMSVCMIIFGIVYAVRCAIAGCDGIIVLLFGCIAVVGYKLMYQPSIQELRDERAQNNTSHE